MIALSVHQPFAEWIASGRKTIEVRSWPTPHRGELLIVSTKAYRLLGPDGNPLPSGVAVALVDVLDCRRLTARDSEAACVPTGGWAFGLILSNPRRVAPVPIRGAQKLYGVPWEELLGRWQAAHPPVSAA